MIFSIVQILRLTASRTKVLHYIANKRFNDVVPKVPLWYKVIILKGCFSLAL